jgi:hypothetical protein
MQISNGLMDIFLNYNGRVGDVNGAKEAISEYENLAENASTPEERERYAEGVERLKTEILPKMQKEMEQLGSQLGLNTGLMGQVIEKDDLTNLAMKRGLNGSLSFITSYESGSYYHNKI